MDSLLPALNHMSRHQRMQPFQPEACGFGFAVPEHPRLYDLVRLAPKAGHNANGVFNGDARYIGLRKHQEKGRAGLLPSIEALCLKMPRTRN